MSILCFSKYDPSLGLSMRTMREGPESRLVDMFISHFYETKGKKEQEYAVFFEPLLPTGFPDIVIAEYNRSSYAEWYSFRNNLEITDLKILHHLYSIKKTTPELLVSQLGFPEHAVFRSLERLLDAKLVTRHNKKWGPIPLHKAYGITSLQAIEAKVSDWDCVLNQAFLNKWFASESYILLPIITPSKRNQSRASSQGIGIYTMSNNRHKIKRYFAAPKGKNPTSYVSWLFNEWIGRRITGCYDGV